MGGSGGSSPAPVNLVLRMRLLYFYELPFKSFWISYRSLQAFSNFFIWLRNPKRELNDIRFEFAVGKDSAEGIAAELVGAGLVDGRDIVVIAANLQKLIDTQSQCKTVTFPLVRSFIFIHSDI